MYCVCVFIADAIHRYPFLFVWEKVGKRASDCTIERNRIIKIHILFHIINCAKQKTSLKKKTRLVRSSRFENQLKRRIASNFVNDDIFLWTLTVINIFSFALFFSLFLLILACLSTVFTSLHLRYILCATYRCLSKCNNFRGNKEHCTEGSYSSTCIYLWRLKMYIIHIWILFNPSRSYTLLLFGS